MATKLKPTEQIGDDLPILKWQINRIMYNCDYQQNTKDEYVQWATEDVSRTSLRSITQAQAKQIIRAQEGTVPINFNSENWAVFEKDNPKHKLILSLLRQANWTEPHPKYGEVADLKRLDVFLKSDKSPVKKPLKGMSDIETEKVIKALKGIVKSRYK